MEPGTRLGPYEIDEPLGKGGMGEVYRARDTKLDRGVAIKVLPAELADDPQRLGRLEREARLLASLNHPNIAAIHGLEETGEGRPALVLELVEGPTLADRIEQGPVPLEEVLGIGLQIAEALEAAHERGIVHRDLKPANVKVGPDGTVKVLDFGLAKALEEEPAEELADSPTLSMAATRAGIILGTAAYMSPEQARGRAVDKRADIWAFGCVLYEMLTGDRAFGGETVTDVLAAVVHREPDLDELPPATPPRIRRLLRRCFAKDSRARLRDVGEARITIEEEFRGVPDEAVEAAAYEPPPAWRRALPWSVAALALIAAAAIWAGSGAERPRPLRKFEVAVSGGVPAQPAISPDGRRIAYLAGGRLWVRELDRFEPRELSGTERAEAPFWSPSGEELGYFRDGRLWRLPAAGGESSAICEVPTGISEGVRATWGGDGRIVFSQDVGALLSVSARGGDPVAVFEHDPDRELDFHDPVLLPGGGLAYIVHRTGEATEPIDTVEVWNGEDRRVVLRMEGQRLSRLAWSATGHLVFAREGTNPGIWALPLSAAGLRPGGEPFIVVPGGSEPSTAVDGTLVFVQGARSGVSELAWMGRDGQLGEIVGQPQRLLSFPDISADGTRVVVEAIENENVDVWMHDVRRGTKTRLTFDAIDEFQPAFSPDGTLLAFVRGSGDPGEFEILVKPVDGSGEAEIVGPGAFPSFSPDGAYLVATTFSDDRVPRTIRALPLRDPGGGGSSGGESQPGDGGWIDVVAESEGSVLEGRVSPNGEYLAYVSTASGRAEIYLRRFPGGGGLWQASVDGGFWPRWSRDGSELYFVSPSGNIIQVVSVSYEPTLELGTRRTVAALPAPGFSTQFGWPPSYDVGPDGRFLVVRGAELEGDEGTSPGLRVVQSWFEEFRPR